MRNSPISIPPDLMGIEDEVELNTKEVTVFVENMVINETSIAGMKRVLIVLE